MRGYVYYQRGVESSGGRGPETTKFHPCSSQILTLSLSRCPSLSLFSSTGARIVLLICLSFSGCVFASGYRFRVSGANRFGCDFTLSYFNQTNQLSRHVSAKTKEGYTFSLKVATPYRMCSPAYSYSFYPNFINENNSDNMQ